MLSLREKYQKQVVPKMKEKFGYKNNLAVPKIEKAVINTGFGGIVAGKSNDEQKKFQKTVSEDFSIITGQKPILTKAKQSIAGFKLREGQKVGAVVTLRKKRMEQFLERLIHIALPRSRDFRGINQKSVDKSGNLTIPIKEQIAFPEVSPEKAKNIFGFEITVVTTAKTKEQGMELLKLLGFPIKS